MGKRETATFLRRRRAISTIAVEMDPDLQPNAEQPHLTHRVNAFAGVCISVHLCLSVASSFQLPFLG